MVLRLDELVPQLPFPFPVAGISVELYKYAYTIKL